MTFFLIVGAIAFAIGLLSIFSSRFNQYLDRAFPDSELDKRVFSQRERYVIRRYVSGIRGIILGIVAMAVYVASNELLRSTISTWFNAITEL
jgi:4-hydroxybenzoate polyprenyltransferase